MRKVKKGVPSLERSETLMLRGNSHRHFGAPVCENAGLPGADFKVIHWDHVRLRLRSGARLAKKGGQISVDVKGQAPDWHVTRFSFPWQEITGLHRPVVPVL
jgi:hypothetical protein